MNYAIQKLEGGSGWGTHINPWLIHVNVWQKQLLSLKSLDHHTDVPEINTNDCRLQATSDPLFKTLYPLPQFYKMS